VIKIRELLVLLLLLSLGLGLRLYDLTDQPIDFHSTRQLRGALIARSQYYNLLPQADPAQRETAIRLANATGRYEPPIIENLVARTYLLAGGEVLWAARVWNGLFWLVGGLFLYFLARRMLNTGSAMAALGYYLILPFAVQASRSFQPDPGMVMWIILSVYALYRWWEKPTWSWAILAGLLGGIAILTKIVAGFIIAGAAAAILLSALGWRSFWRHLQVYLMAALMLMPSFLYYSSSSGRASEYLEGWTFSLSHLLLDPATYMRWFNTIQDLMGLGAVLLGLIGVVIAGPRNRNLLVGLWVGYLVYGLFLPYQMYTHSYYHLQLTPILALSLVPIAQIILDRVAQQGRLWQIACGLVVLIGITFASWTSIIEQMREDFRVEPAYWREIASYLPEDGKILALTQDYGYRLMYYGWRKVVLWPNRGERKLSNLRGITREFEEFFANRIDGKDYFLVTAFNQFNDQPDLKQLLNDRYPLIAQSPGYLIYDLAKPLQ
jgi:4-amino-4-deoxy-L-arabinose transferase-like glycosyltransferase